MKNTMQKYLFYLKQQNEKEKNLSFVTLFNNWMHREAFH